MTDEPTPRQREVLDFVRDRLAADGRPPTMREAAAHFGWSSNGAVRCHLAALERKGLLRWDRGDARGVRLAGEFGMERVRRLPLVGSVPAGMPAEAIPESDETLPIPESMFPAPCDLFALRVFGDSMVGAGRISK
jgi:repressor LexA